MSKKIQEVTVGGVEVESDTLFPTLEGHGSFKYDGPIESNLINDAEIIYRFFLRRDEMNAEVHSTGMTNVRYSPITIAAERVLNFLYKERYKFDAGSGAIWKEASTHNRYFEDEQKNKKIRPHYFTKG